MLPSGTEVGRHETETEPEKGQPNLRGPINFASALNLNWVVKGPHNLKIN